MSPGALLFILAPAILALLLLWIDPSLRHHIRLRSIATYFLVMTALIWAAMQVVAWLASGRVRAGEVLIVLWFTVAWRLAWALWTRMMRALGRQRLRAARWRRLRGERVPVIIRLIPPLRAALTATIFIPLFLSTILTHRFKIQDGQDPLNTLSQQFEHVRVPTADGLTLDAWFIPQDGPAGPGTAERTILICHGAGANKGNFIWFLAPLIDRGYNVAFFDFRAHGASDGRTISYGIHERQDVLAMVD
jgi:hypothetical protein